MDVAMEVKDKSYLDSIPIEVTVKNFVMSKESKFGIVVGTNRQCGILHAILLRIYFLKI